MKILLLVLLLLPFLNEDGLVNNTFITEQKKHTNVQVAYSEKLQTVQARLKTVNLNLSDLTILLVSYKAEKELELYVKSKAGKKFTKLLTYQVCRQSGRLGPKREQGDKQVPEGFYTINRFHPKSNYFLSLGLDYPNQSDQILSKAENLGGDIFIHGRCVTFGCLPMTDEKIKEIYIYAVQATGYGQKNIPVYSFPFRMNETNLAEYKYLHQDDEELLKFWDNLAQGYSKFTANQEALQFHVNPAGRYVFR